MALNALVESFLPQSEKSVGLKGCNKCNYDSTAVTAVVNA